MGAQTPAAEAWSLIWQITQRHKPRLLELARQLDFSPVQLHLLRLLEPGEETPMRVLAQQLFCDPSNVTGIVDRLEARGLIERREAERDRRMKVVGLTEEGERMRATRRHQPGHSPAGARRAPAGAAAGVARCAARGRRASEAQQRRRPADVAQRVGVMADGNDLRALLNSQLDGGVGQVLELDHRCAVRGTAVAL